MGRHIMSFAPEADSQLVEKYRMQRLLHAVDSESFFLACQLPAESDATNAVDSESFFLACQLPAESELLV